MGAADRGIIRLMEQIGSASKSDLGSMLKATIGKLGGYESVGLLLADAISSSDGVAKERLIKCLVDLHEAAADDDQSARLSLVSTEDVLAMVKHLVLDSLPKSVTCDHCKKETAIDMSQFFSEETFSKEHGSEGSV